MFGGIFWDPESKDLIFLQLWVQDWEFVWNDDVDNGDDGIGWNMIEYNGIETEQNRKEQK